MERKIEVITTGQSGIIPVYTGASKWSELKTDLTKNGVNYNGMKAVVGQTRVTLEHADAQLPEGEFELFLMPEKTDKGLSRGEINQAIKQAIEAGTPKDFFSFNGKNYTQVSSDILEKKLSELMGGQPVSAAPESPSPKTESKPTVNVQTVNGEENYGVRMSKRIFELANTTKDEMLDEVYEEDEDAYEAAKDNLNEIGEISIELEQFCANFGSDSDKKATSTTVPTAENEAKQMAIKAQQEAREKSEQKQREARQLAAGFSDVRNY